MFPGPVTTYNLIDPAIYQCGAASEPSPSPTEMPTPSPAADGGNEDSTTRRSSTQSNGGGGPDYTVPGLKRTPLRGSICETFINPDEQTIFGPFDAGFDEDASAFFFNCVAGTVLSGGIDTRSELMRVRHLGSLGQCDADPQIFDDCGGKPWCPHHKRCGTALLLSLAVEMK